MKPYLPLAALALLSLVACDVNKSAVVSDSGVSKKSVSVTTDGDGWSIEQRNIAERLKIDNLPGSIKHLYIISPYSGDTLIYSTVKGKVTSGGKRLTPTSVVVGASGDFKRNGFGGPGGTTTSEVLQDDGSYGSSCEYIFWWDVQGRYHQHFFTGGQIIHVADQPLPVSKVIINIEATK